VENTLAIFALEYAECRGNLNKEQAFFSLCLWQYAVSRQELYKLYLESCIEKHPDLLRMRQQRHILSSFGYATNPHVPSMARENLAHLKSTSKPYKIVSSCFQNEDFKENLPHSSAYVSIQLSQDGQQIFVGCLVIDKERK